MSLRTETRDIRGYQVECTQFAAMRGFKLFARLGKVLAPAIAAFAGGDEQADMGPSFISAANTLIEDFAIIPALLQSTSVSRDGVRLALDKESGINACFGGDILGLVHTIAFAIEVNFSDFLSEGLKLQGAVKARTEQKEPV